MNTNLFNFTQIGQVHERRHIIAELEYFENQVENLFVWLPVLSGNKIWKPRGPTKSKHPTLTFPGFRL